MSRLVPITAIACLLVAGAAHADPPRLYGQLHGGLSFGHDSDVSDRRGPVNGQIRYEHAEFQELGNTGWNGGGALGLHFNHGEKHSFRAEISGGYDRLEIKKLVVKGQNRARGGTLSVANGMASGYYEHDFGNLALFKAFIGAGVGVGFVEFADPAGASRVLLDDDSVEVAWHASAGLVLPLADHVDLTATYRFLGTTEAEIEATAIDPATGLLTRSGKVDTEVGIHGAQLGIRFTF